MKLGYRPEVDGLRTIAVLLVILHHLGWNALSGGYVGVDVFFVISGYLITSIVYTEISDGKFSIANFYKRRIIRLAPAYFLVLGVTSIASLLFMLPAELLNYAASVLYSTFFAANFYMWKEVGGYFGAQSEYVPLLHLWSLAAEEQFYIFWPMILYCAYRFINRRFILPLFLFAAIGGAAISQWGVQNYLAASYYLLPTRFFEMMIGALIAIGPQIKFRTNVGRDLLGLIGFSLIAWSAVTFTTQSLFPGYSALIPCFGALFIIAFTHERRGLVGCLLSSPVMVYLGKLSYPAYLWHWPIIAFINLHQVEIDWWVGLLVLAATLILSALTHQYAERPFKATTRSQHFRKVATWGFLVPSLFATSFVFAMNSLDGLSSRFSDELNLKSAALQSRSNKIRGRCNEGNVSKPLTEEECVLGVKNRPVDFLLVGDSHANHFTGMLDIMAKDAGIRGYDITQSGTIYLPGVKRFYFQDGNLIEFNNFEIRNKQLDSIIERKKFKAVILAGYFKVYYSSGELKFDSINDSTESFERSFFSAVEKIKKSGSMVYIINDSPALLYDDHQCSLNNLRFKDNKKCSYPVLDHLKNFEKWNVFLSRLIDKYPDITIIDPSRVICDQVNCYSELNGLPLYLDKGHLNYMGSELIGKIYIHKFGNPLLKLRNEGPNLRFDSGVQ